MKNICYKLIKEIVLNGAGHKQLSIFFCKGNRHCCYSFLENKQEKLEISDFLKFVFILLDAQEFSAGPSEFLPDLHFLCKIVLKPSNVIPLLLFQSSRALSVFNFIRTGRGLKIGEALRCKIRPTFYQKIMLHIE